MDDLPISGNVEEENTTVGVETESQFPCVNSTVPSTNSIPDILITTSTPPMHHQTATINIFRASEVDAQVSDINSQYSDTESPPIQPNDAAEFSFLEGASSSSFKLPPSVKKCIGIRKEALKQLSALTRSAESGIHVGDSAREDGGTRHVNNPRFDAIRTKFQDEAVNLQHNLVSGSLDSAANDSFPEDLYVTANFSSRSVNELQTPGTFTSPTSDSRSVDEEWKTPASFRSVSDSDTESPPFQPNNRTEFQIDPEHASCSSYRPTPTITKCAGIVKGAVNKLSAPRVLVGLEDNGGTRHVNNPRFDAIRMKFEKEAANRRLEVLRSRSINADSISINEVWGTPGLFETITSESSSINEVWDTPEMFRPIPAEQEGLPGPSRPTLTSIHSSRNATNVAQILLHRRTCGTKRRRSTSFQTLTVEGSSCSSHGTKRQRNETIRGRLLFTRKQRRHSN